MYRFLWTITWPFFRIFLPTKIVGRKNIDKKGPAILVCNHYSNFDVPLFGSYMTRKMNFLGKKELFSTRFKAWFMRNMQVIKIDREKVDLEAVKKSLSVLKNGELLTIFPEGTRNKDSDELQDIKNGVCLLAIRARVKIIPVNILKRPKMFTRNRIVIGEPFLLDQFYEQRPNSERLEQAGQIVYEKMKNLEQQNKAMTTK